MLFLDEFYGGV